jgi:hypothetical protein
MSYLNKIVLCFTKQKIIGHQYEDKIVCQYGYQYKTLQEFYDDYSTHKVKRRLVRSKSFY